MIFVKLLGIMAALLVLAVVFIILPQAASRRLATGGSKLRELPVCIMTAFLAAAVICYCVMKNTFGGFVSAWSAVFLLFCWILTVIQFFVGQRRFSKKYFVKYSANFIILANLVVVLILAGTVVYTDKKFEELPASDEIVLVYIDTKPLERETASGDINPDYAVVYSEKIGDLVKDKSETELSGEEVTALLSNLSMVTTSVRSDVLSRSEVLRVCEDLNAGFFTQRFSKTFKTTENDQPEKCVYITLKLKNGDYIKRRFECEKYDVSLSTDELYNEEAYLTRLGEMQALTESDTPKIAECGIFYRADGMNGEEILMAADYDAVFAALVLDGILPELEPQEPSVNRMSIYCVNNYALPEIYGLFGVPNREERLYYNIVKANQNSWETISEVLARG